MLNPGSIYSLKKLKITGLDYCLVTRGERSGENMCPAEIKKKKEKVGSAQDYS